MSHNIKSGVAQESLNKTILLLYIVSLSRPYLSPFRWLEQWFVWVNGCTGQMDSIKSFNGM